MKAIILVGGEGLRLRPLTCNIPKPMVPVVNKPFLEHKLDNLKKHQIDEVVFAICYLPEQIESYFGDGSNIGMRLEYIIEQSPLGTGGAVKNAESFFDDTFVVCNGDIFTDLDLTDMIESHRKYQAKATIALTPVENPTAYGIVEIDSGCGVRAFIEKPSADAVTSNLINAGTYIFEPEVLDLIPPDVFSMVERGLFPDLVEQEAPFLGYRSAAYWIDIGKPADYLKLHCDILTEKAVTQLPGKPTNGGIRIEEGCNIHPSAKLTGPIIIGSDCSIEKDVQITGPTSLGAKCVIGESVVLDSAILWQNVRLGRNVTIRNSVIGNNSHIGDGTMIEGESIVSDDVSIGSSNTLNNGIRIWPGNIIKDSAISF